MMMCLNGKATIEFYTSVRSKTKDTELSKVGLDFFHCHLVRYTGKPEKSAILSSAPVEKG